MEPVRAKGKRGDAAKTSPSAQWGLSWAGLQLRAAEDVLPSLKRTGKEVEEGLCSAWMLAGPAWVVSRGSWLRSLFTQGFVVQEAFRAAPCWGWGA